MACNWCPVLAAGRLDHFSFVRGGEVTQSNIQRLRPEAGSQRQAERSSERCRCFPALPAPRLLALRDAAPGCVCVCGGGGVFIVSFACWTVHTASQGKIREGLTQLEEFRYRWPDLRLPTQ